MVKPQISRVWQESKRRTPVEDPPKHTNSVPHVFASGNSSTAAKHRVSKRFNRPLDSQVGCLLSNVAPFLLMPSLYKRIACQLAGRARLAPSRQSLHAHARARRGCVDDFFKRPTHPHPQSLDESRKVVLLAYVVWEHVTRVNAQGICIRKAIRTTLESYTLTDLWLLSLCFCTSHLASTALTALFWSFRADVGTGKTRHLSQCEVGLNDEP